MKSKTDFFEELKPRLLAAVQALPAGEGRVAELCRFLQTEVPAYDWVGVYWVDGEDELVLGPYTGEATDHTRIKFGQGICGQSAATKQTFLVEDVSAESNYLSCSVHVKSEIVVPVFNAQNQMVGQIDIDSHTLAAFTAEDQLFLESLTPIVAENR